MQWLRLKIWLIPAIMQEVDTVTITYINMINELRRNNDRDTLSEFLNLRQEIENRIEQIDNFYEENLGDQRIFNFEKARIRLKKLLMYDPDVMNKMDLESNNFKGVNMTYTNEVAMTNPDFKTSVNFNNILHPVTESRKLKSEHREFNNLHTHSSRTPPRTNKKIVQEKETSEISPFDFNNDIPMIAQTEMSLKNTFKSKMIVADSKEEEQNWKDLVFKLKLTEPEYKLLLKEKSKIVVKSNKFFK